METEALKIADGHFLTNRDYHVQYAFAAYTLHDRAGTLASLLLYNAEKPSIHISFDNQQLSCQRIARIEAILSQNQPLILWYDEVVKTRFSLPSFAVYYPLSATV